VPRGLRLRKRIERARENITPWKQARKDAIKEYRKRGSFARVAELGNTSRQWVAKWWKRFCQAGKSYDALKDKSSKPHTIHRKRDDFEDEILEAKERFPHFGAIKLKRVTNIPLSHTTIHKVLADNDLVNTRKTTWRKYKRFERPTPNYLWQMDITQVPLPEGQTGFICSILDDHSRLILASKVFDKELTTGCVLSVLWGAIRQFGPPKQVLTDRGAQFWNNSVDPSLFTLALYWAEGIQHIMARPRHPRTIGKIERWHRSFKEEWCDRHEQPADHAGLGVLLSRWVDHYNSQRPHCSLDYKTPAEVYLMGLMTEESVYRLVNEVP
jgi:transposase InsO family protein